MLQILKAHRIELPDLVGRERQHRDRHGLQIFFSPLRRHQYGFDRGHLAGFSLVDGGVSGVRRANQPKHQTHRSRAAEQGGFHGIPHSGAHECLLILADSVRRF